MKRLLEIAKFHGVSRPIFKLNVKDNGLSIGFDTWQPIHQYRPSKNGDALEHLIAMNYKEKFDRDTGRFFTNPEEMTNSAVCDAITNVRIFIKNNLDTKAPEQTKLYKWLRNLQRNSNEELTLIIISMYKYLYTFTNANMTTPDNKQDHAVNAINLLTALQEKYDK